MVNETRKKRKSVEGIEGNLLASAPKGKRRSKAIVLSPAQKAGIDCFKEVRVEYPIFLPPSSLGEPSKGIIKTLSRHLMRYSKRWDGVAIAINEPYLLQPTASFVSDQAHVHFSITCKFLVFAPPLGSKLIGVVNHIGFDYIGLLVLGTLSVTIYARNLPQFVRDVEEDCWKRKDTGETIHEGTKLLFCVKEIQKAKDAYSIVGSILESDTGILEVKEDGSMELAEGKLLPPPQTNRKTFYDSADDQAEEVYESASDADLTPVQPREPILVTGKLEETPTENKEEEEEEVKLEDVELMEAPKVVNTKKRKRVPGKETPKKKRKVKHED